MAKRPTMYVIAGPNGAGKSTLYEHQIRDDSTTRNVEFINADLIQRDRLADPSPEAAYTAARLAETRRREVMARRQSFITESTFSHPSKLALIDDAKAQGYRVAVFHVQVRSPNISVDRVRQRVDSGGHPVPEQKIRERFERNQALIRQAVLKADAAMVYDNSNRFEGPRQIIQFHRGRVSHVEPSKSPKEGGSLPAWARKLYGEELKQFSPTRLNAAAASFAQALEIAQKLGGKDVQVGIAGRRKGQYQGPIVGESSQHVLQQTGQREYIAHFNNQLSRRLAMGQEVTISYAVRGHGTVMIAKTPQASSDTDP